MSSDLAGAPEGRRAGGHALGEETVRADDSGRAAGLARAEAEAVDMDVVADVDVVEAVEAVETVGATDDGVWLTVQEREAWLALNAIMLRMPALLEQQLQRDSDLSYFEYMVLAVLAEQEPPRLRMSQLSLLTSGSLSRLSHVAKRLEAKDYITRETDAIDRRSTNAILTPAGLAKVRDCAPGHVAWVRHIFFDNLSGEQLEQFCAIGEAVLPRVDPGGELTNHGR